MTFTPEQLKELRALVEILEGTSLITLQVGEHKAALGAGLQQLITDVLKETVERSK